MIVPSSIELLDLLFDLADAVDLFLVGLIHVPIRDEFAAVLLCPVVCLAG